MSACEFCLEYNGKHTDDCADFSVGELGDRLAEKDKKIETLKKINIDLCRYNSDIKATLEIERERSKTRGDSLMAATKEIVALKAESSDWCEKWTEAGHELLAKDKEIASLKAEREAYRQIAAKWAQKAQIETGEGIDIGIGECLKIVDAEAKEG